MAFRGFLTEEDVVIVGLTLTIWGEAVAVQYPSVEDDQPADV